MAYDRQQIKSVEDLILLFEKAVRSLRIYPPGHPRAAAFLDEAFKRFKTVLAWLHPLRLVIDRHDILLDGTSVYSNPERDESLAFILFRDGIREITIHSGLEKEELRVLSEAFGREIDDEHLDEDLATYLWEHDLEHVTVRVIDDYFDDFLPEELKDAEDFLGIIKEQVAARDVPPEELKSGILTEPFTSMKATVLPLKKAFLDPEKLRTTPREIQHIRNLLAREQEELYFEDVLEIIISMLLGEKDADQAEVYISLFRNMLQLLLVSGPVSQAVLLLRKLRRLADGHGRLPPAIVGSLEAFFLDLGSPRLMASLGESIRLGRLDDPEFIPDLIAFYPPRAVGPLTDLFETVDSMKMRKAICHGLSIIARGGLDELVRALRSTKWYVVRNVAYTLGLTVSPEAVDDTLGPLVDHGDVRVRKEALRAMGRIGGPGATEWIMEALDHPDGETRKQALSSIPKTGNRKLQEKILALVRSEAFDDRSPAEREGFYRLLGQISGDDLVPLLEGDFLSTRWFATKSRHERQYFASLALAGLNTTAARERLTRVLPLADDRTSRVIRAFLSRSHSSLADRGGAQE